MDFCGAVSASTQSGRDASLTAAAQDRSRQLGTFRLIGPSSTIPIFRGRSEYWYAGQAGRGYGANNYRYTYAIGGAAQPDNTAVWDLGNRVGTQELQVFVPCNHAVATVRYEVLGAGTTRQPEVNQATQCGHTQWTSLGEFDFNSGSASVVLRDNNSDQHFLRGELWQSSFGVDAIRARCVSNCGVSEPALDQLGTPRNLAAEYSACPGYERGCVDFSWSPPPSSTTTPVTVYEYELSTSRSYVE